MRILAYVSDVETKEFVSTKGYGIKDVFVVMKAINPIDFGEFEFRVGVPVDIAETLKGYHGIFDKKDNEEPKLLRWVKPVDPAEEWYE